MSKRKKSVGNYPYYNVVFSITTALFMIGLFCIFALLANRLTSNVKNNVEMQVFLKKELEAYQIKAIKDSISSKPYIATDTKGPRVRFVPKEEAAKEMIQETGEDFVNFLGENPLRDAFIVNIKESSYNNTKMAEIKSELTRLSGVFEVVYTERLIDEINHNIKSVGVVVGIFVAILLFTVVVLINNSIKLALFSQRFLIRSMQLVGATSMFIKRPFLIRASLQGVLSGAMASVFSYAILLLISSQIREIKTLYGFFDLVFIFMFLMLMGGIIGYLSAYSAVSRYLRMKLDELY